MAALALREHRLSLEHNNHRGRATEGPTVQRSSEESVQLRRAAMGHNPATSHPGT